MFTDQQYRSLTRHLHLMLRGISEHQDTLPVSLQEELDEGFYETAIQKLNKRKRKLEKHKQAYKKAERRFYEEFEQVRQEWKKDVIQLKRIFRNKRDEESKLRDFGVYKSK